MRREEEVTREDMPKRPIGVTILGVLALLAALVAVYNTLQMLHIFPFKIETVFFGEQKFFAFDIFGALLWGMLAAIYIWLFQRLWKLDPQGWLFVVVLSTLNLILAFVTVIGATPWQTMLPAIVVNGLILLYGLLPGTKDAFGVQSQ